MTLIEEGSPNIEPKDLGKDVKLFDAELRALARKWHRKAPRGRSRSKSPTVSIRNTWCNCSTRAFAPGFSDISPVPIPKRRKDRPEASLTFLPQVLSVLRPPAC